MLVACITLTMELTSAKIKHAWAPEAYQRTQGFNTGGCGLLGCHSHVLVSIVFLSVECVSVSQSVYYTPISI